MSIKEFFENTNQTEKLPVGDLDIRTAVKKDVKAVVAIEDYTSASPWSEDSIAKDIAEHDRAIVIVAVDKQGRNDGDFKDLVTGGMVIGYADCWMVAGEAQLNNIAVLAKYRGNGVGEALLSVLMHKAASNCDSMNLEVRKSNYTAIALYSKLGFTKDGVRKAYYKDNYEDAVLMSAPLSRQDIQVDFEIS